MDCHANRADYPVGTPLTAMSPKGGFVFNLPIGNMHSPNITADAETGIGKLTDAQIARTLRYGVSSDNRAILDFMPFHNMSDEDLAAIISYLRTIPPVKNKVPTMEYNLVGKIVKAFLLKPVGPDGEVPRTVQRGPTAEYGKYLANNVANCRGCHTNRDLMTGKFIGEDFGGGLKLDVVNQPGKFFVTRNLTPDPQYGHIKDWSQEVFVSRFRNGRVYKDSPMPWEAFQNFSDDDLIAIYKYLKTVKPVHADAGPILITENP
jgi:hypothetical protein